MNDLMKRQRHFDGITYQPELDFNRLSTQLERVRALTLGSDWWTLRELADRTGASEASVSARLRDLRKQRFGGYTVERRRVSGGLWQYKVSQPVDNIMKGDVL